MPLGDGTGPAGLGPMTGRAAGFCAGFQVPGYMNPGFGRGFGYWTAPYGGYPVRPYYPGYPAFSIYPGIFPFRGFRPRRGWGRRRGW